MSLPVSPLRRSFGGEQPTNYMSLHPIENTGVRAALSRRSHGETELARVCAMNECADAPRRAPREQSRPRRAAADSCVCVCVWMRSTQAVSDRKRTQTWGT
jgi:hypothetical protein